MCPRVTRRETNERSPRSGSCSCSGSFGAFSTLLYEPFLSGSARTAVIRAPAFLFPRDERNLGRNEWRASLASADPPSRGSVEGKIDFSLNENSRNFLAVSDRRAGGKESRGRRSIKNSVATRKKPGETRSITSRRIINHNRIPRTEPPGKPRYEL